MLSAQLRVLVLFCFKCLFADIEYISVHGLHVLTPSDGLTEILCGSLLLKLLDLQPDVIGNV